MHQYHLFDTTTRWQRLSTLIEMGGEILDGFRDEGSEVNFQPWFVALKKRASVKQLNLDHSDAEWLWDVLRSEPSVQRDFGNLPPVGKGWFERSEQITVLDEGERFAVALKSTDVHELSRESNENTEPRIVVRLLEPLRMRPGKASRLECCKVMSELTIPVDQALTADAEAAILRADAQLVTVTGNTIKVITKSLNQAHTMASRRLEPGQRGPSGHAYDRLIYLGKDGRPTLEEIRKMVETRNWVPPADASAD